MRALLMDGDARAAFAIAHMLTTAGWIVDHADSAAQGLTRAEQNHYQAVVSDLILPDISGRELVRRIRGTNLMRPLLVVSQASEENARMIALEAGADGYIQKPVGRTQLLTRLRWLLRLPEESTASYPPPGAFEPMAGVAVTTRTGSVSLHAAASAFPPGLRPHAVLLKGD